MGVSIKLACAVAVAALLLAACTSTVHGQGGSASSATSAQTSSAPTSSAAPTSVPVTPSSTIPSSAPTSVPTSLPSVPAPRGCRTSACAVTEQVGLGGDETLVLHFVEAATKTFLEVRHGATSVFWRGFPYEVAGDLRCNISGSVRNCVLVDGVGAHGSVAYALVWDGTTLRTGVPVTSDTPIIDIVDLDHDNRLDVAVLLNDYNPSYAAGHVQWQTYRRSADGATLTATGCGPLSGSKPPQPTDFLTGTCAS